MAGESDQRRRMRLWRYATKTKAESVRLKNLARAKKNPCKAVVLMRKACVKRNSYKRTEGRYDQPRRAYTRRSARHIRFPE